MRPRPHQSEILHALLCNPKHSVESFRELALQVSGPQRSPAAEVELVHEVALTSELLALAGFVKISWEEQALIQLTERGQRAITQQHHECRFPLATSLAVSALLCSCTAMTNPTTVSPPSLSARQQRLGFKIEQVIDAQGHRQFAPCSACPSPTPKTLAATPLPLPLAKVMPIDSAEMSVVSAQDTVSSPAAIPVGAATLSHQSDTQISFEAESRYVVFFRFGQHRLDAQQTAELRGLAKQLSGKSVVVTASTDAAGPPSVNHHLAKQRADSVVNALREGGLASTAVHTEAVPERPLRNVTVAQTVGSKLPTSFNALARHAEVKVHNRSLAADQLLSIHQSGRWPK